MSVDKKWDLLSERGVFGAVVALCRLPYIEQQPFLHSAIFSRSKRGNEAKSVWDLERTTSYEIKMAANMEEELDDHKRFLDLYEGESVLYQILCLHSLKNSLFYNFKLLQSFTACCRADQQFIYAGI